MTIMCPAEFAETCEFADTVDEALEAAISATSDTEKREKLLQLRGRGKRSLLHCIGMLAKWDHDYNEGDPRKRFHATTTITYRDGRVRNVGDVSSGSLPVRETYLFEDSDGHSFFFRELWIDPDTRTPVEVADTVHFCAPVAAIGQEDLDSLPEDKLYRKWLNGELEMAYTERGRDARVKAGNSVRTVIRRRNGLCGGVIYHPVFADGQVMHYGSWSIHT